MTGKQSDIRNELITVLLLLSCHWTGKVQDELGSQKLT